MWIHHRDRSFNDLYDFYFWNIFHSKTRARKAIDRSQLSFSTTAQFAAATAPTRSCSTLVCQWRGLGAAVTAFPPQSVSCRSPRSDHGGRRHGHGGLRSVGLFHAQRSLVPSCSALEGMSRQLHLAQPNTAQEQERNLQTFLFPSNADRSCLIKLSLWRVIFNVFVYEKWFLGQPFCCLFFLTFNL